MSTTNQTNYKCSFCGKAQGQVNRVFAGPDRVFICDECVALCAQIMTEDAPPPDRESIDAMPQGITPKWIYKRLEEYVVGQEQSKKVLSVAVYNHYKRIRSNRNPSPEVELQKANVLMIGPAGSGKTLLAQTLAKILDVPFTIADATSLTEAGYVGEDVENILLRLIQAADGDVTRAEQGIIYIDEIDKIARKSPNPSITRDVSGEGVQQALLKIIEGSIANVPPQGGRKHPHQEFVQIKTDDILFMCGGAFEGLADIIDYRLSRDRTTLGFGALPKTKDGTTPQGDYLFEHVLGDDLLEYGFIPELVGRLPVSVGLRGLDKDALIKVLLEPKNSFVKQYQALFAMDNVTLEFTDEALDAAAEEAARRGTGARGLRAIMEETLLDAMYQLPAPNVVRCIVDGDAIVTGEAKLEYGSDEAEPLQSQERKSA